MKGKQVSASPSALDKIRQLEDQVAELKQMNRNKALWLASLAHDFKGIFSNILWIAQTVESGSISRDTLFDLLPDLKQAAEHNLNALEATFSAAKVQMHARESVQNTIHFREIFKALTAYFDEYATRKNIRLEFRGDPEGQLETNALFLLSALYKILDNAFKFSYKGGLILFSAEKMPSGKTRFSVEDFGVGMDSKTLERVFSLDRAPFLGTLDELGPGFGLSLAKEILNILEGTIHISSTEQVGTRVLLEL